MGWEFQRRVRTRQPQGTLKSSQQVPEDLKGCVHEQGYAHAQEISRKD